MLGCFRQNAAEYLRANIVSYFFIILILVIGVVVGAFAVKTLPEEQKSELINYLSILFHRLNSPAGYNPGDTHALFTTLVLNNLKTIGLIWLLGFTIVGIPFVLFIVFTRGFVIGFTVGFLVDEYVARGLLFALASVLPHNFFAIPALLIAGVSAISFSLMLMKRKSQGKNNLLYNSIGYTAICFTMLLLLIVSAAIEAYVSPVFMKLVAGLLVTD
ncbi:MAG: stage II sporulation protein M [Negativicutes bacterium]|nr:stage II sporulation protein M [Negativicutes bacterium]